MTTYNTGNPLGSSAPKDLFDNAQNLDKAVNDLSRNNWSDRFGVKRKTWQGIEKSAADAMAAFGYITLDSFEDGATLTLPNQVLRWKNTGEYYRWDGAFPKVVPAGSTPATAGGVDTGAWVSVGDASLRQNLSSGESGLGSALVADGAYFSVKDVLARIRTLADVGSAPSHLGYNPTQDAIAYDAMGEASDRQMLLNGSLHLAGMCAQGIRRNMNILSVRGGQESSGDGFNLPLLGVQTARELRNYGLYESVPFYLDMTSPERQSYHTVATATYTATSATIDPTTYAETLQKLKVGDYIRTMHDTYCVGFVKAIDITTGVITVDEWATSLTTTVTPTDGVGLYTRYITKPYAANINLFITENSDVTNASGVELGMVSHKDVSGSVIGLDIPVLSQSDKDMTAGIVIRHATTNGSGLLYGVRVADARINFHSAGGSGTGRDTLIGINEQSDALVGIRRNNQNTYSDLWSTSGSLVDVSLANSPMIIGPDGADYRQYKHVQVVYTSFTLSGLYPSIIAGAAGITITMPPASSHKAGHEYEIECAIAGEYKIAANNADTNVNGYTTFTFTTTVQLKTVKVKFDGTYWRVTDFN